MNEQEFGYKVRHFLNLGTEGIDSAMVEKLIAARQHALSRQRIASSSLSLAGIGQIGSDFLLPRARTLLAIVVLAFGVAGISYWSSSQQAAEIEDLDSALLSDDLPITAYLDRGFDAWLKHPQQQ